MSASGNPPTPAPFAVLTATLFPEYASLEEALARVVEIGREALPTCVAASITVIDRGQAATVGSSSGVADALDAAQYAADAGPCLTAAREHRTIVVDDVRAEARWAEFGRAGERVGVCSSLSVPLTLHGDVEGGFNAYAAAPAGFDEEAVRVGERFAAAASIVVSNARAYWSAANLTRNLAAALETRGVIEQAKGVLIATMGIGPDEAFDELRRRSQRDNRKLNDLAADIVGDAARRAADGSPEPRSL